MVKVANFVYLVLIERKTIVTVKDKKVYMKEYKIIKQTGTAVKSQQNFEDLINSYAKMNWTVINMFTHRGILKALIEREKKEEDV